MSGKRDVLWARLIILLYQYVDNNSVNYWLHCGSTSSRHRRVAAKVLVMFVFTSRLMRPAFSWQIWCEMGIRNAWTVKVFVTMPSIEVDWRWRRPSSLVLYPRMDVSGGVMVKVKVNISEDGCERTWELRSRLKSRLRLSLRLMRGWRWIRVAIDELLEEHHLRRTSIFYHGALFLVQALLKREIRKSSWLNDAVKADADGVVDAPASVEFTMMLSTNNEDYAVFDLEYFFNLIITE